MAAVWQVGASVKREEQLQAIQSVLTRDAYPVEAESGLFHCHSLMTSSLVSSVANDRDDLQFIWKTSDNSVMG